jgi:hypothetical protein
MNEWQRDRRSKDHKPRARVEHPKGKKICGSCKRAFYATTKNFYRLKHGYLGLATRCKECVHKRKNEYRREDWTRRLIEYTKGRHSRHTTEDYDLTPDMIMQMYEQQNGRCAWFGVSMTTDVAARDPRLVTLDRIDCSRGYTSDNVVLVCRSANQARGDVPSHDFAKFVEEIKRN